MIITVTMNPAIDKTIEVGEFVRGGLNRIKKIKLDVGGKGINVSKTIRALGGESMPIAVVAGSNGEQIKKAVQGVYLEIPGETRINTKMVEADGTVTELNESGPALTEDELQQLYALIKQEVKKGDLVILTGSVPQGVPKDIYKTLTMELKEKGARVFVDADGELFEKALEAKPAIVKPNKYELEKYMKKQMEAQEDYIEAANILLNQGIETVIISLGAEGAYFFSKEHTLYSPGMKVKAHSTVGAGDAMVAAFAYGMEEKMTFEACAKLAIATSAGAVMTIGTETPTRESVDGLMEDVVLLKL